MIACKTVFSQKNSKMSYLSFLSEIGLQKKKKSLNKKNMTIIFLIWIQSANSSSLDIATELKVTERSRMLTRTQTLAIITRSTPFLTLDNHPQYTKYNMTVLIYDESFLKTMLQMFFLCHCQRGQLSQSICPWQSFPTWWVICFKAYSKGKHLKGKLYPFSQIFDMIGKACLRQKL